MVTAPPQPTLVAAHNPTQLMSRLGRTIDDVIVEPCSRCFIVASVGSGKSTLGTIILENYHRRWSHRIYIVDYKRRFFPVPDGAESRVFPAGVKATKHRRREGVYVNGHLADHPSRWVMPHGGVAIIQDESSAGTLFKWLFAHHNIHNPVLLYCDESFDLMHGTRANPDFRRLIQMGRELGIGTLVINQRPSWIDRTFMTEADVVFYGKLNSQNDRLFVLEETALRDFGVADLPVPRFHWWRIDQASPENSFYFTFKA